MIREDFYTALRSRANTLFGTSLSQKQVDGIEALLDACIIHAISNTHHVANILAQVFHETGNRMYPVRETFAATDAQAISRLEAAWKAGKLPWVKTPYWRDGLFGRGPIQITHLPNYQRMGKRMKLDLVGNPNLLLEPKIGADSAVIGMSEGMFTGKKLSDYQFPDALDNAPSSNPRRIVNGQDGTDKKVAGYHRAFFAAIQAAGGWQDKPAPIPPKAPEPAPAPSSGLLAAIVKFILSLFRR